MVQRVFLIFLILPIVLFELFLHFDNSFYEKLLLYNSDFTEWSGASPQVNVWFNTIVLGSSIAREDINPHVIESKINEKEFIANVGSLAVNADSTSTDYLTLKRILKTCKTCPKRIIYQMTDVSLRKHETDIWKNFTLEKLLKLYYIDRNIDILLEEASTKDDKFKAYLSTLKLLKEFRIYFTKGRLVSYFIHNLSKATFKNEIQTYDPRYSDKPQIDEGYGFLSFNNTLNKEIEKITIDHYRTYLDKYQVGGVTELFLENFLDLAKENKISVVLVIPPLSRVYLNTFPREVAMYKSEVLKIAKEKSVPVIDDSHFDSGDYSLYADINHLNRKGSSVYSSHLAKELQPLFVE